MKCRDVQERLSAYIDGATSAEERAIIEEHLKSCQECKTALSDLEKTMSYVKTLDEIEPPAWLSQKVMARVREEAQPRLGILHRLFYPLHIKLPLQAIATILIAVSAFYIFKTIQPEIGPSKVVVDDMTTPQVLLEDKEVSSKRTKIDNGVPSSDEAPASIVTADIPQRERELEKDKSVSKGKVAASLESNERKRVSSERKEEVMTHEAKKPLPAEPMKQLYRGGDIKSADRVEEIPGTQEPAEKEEIMRARSDGMVEDESGVGGISVQAGKTGGEKWQYADITLAVDSLKNAQTSVKTIVEQLEGEIIKTEAFKNRVIIIVTFDVSKTDELFDKLRRIGDIKEDRVVSEQREGQREISIELIEE